MTETSFRVNAEFLEELQYVEELLPLYAKMGSPLEWWEALCLVQADRMMITCEIDRLADELAAGKPAAASATQTRILSEVRQSMGTTARDMRAYLAKLPLELNEPTREMLVGVILITAESRGEMRRWMADPVRRRAEAVEGVQDLCAQMDAYRGELRKQRGTAKREAPAAASIPPALPAGVDGGVLAALRFVEKFREVFDQTGRNLALWEVLCLRMEDPAAAAIEADELLQLKDGGDTIEFNERAIRLFEKLLDVREAHTPLSRSLRGYFGRLPMGHYSDDTMDLALGFILASPEGRRRAVQWLEAPEQYLREAAIRVEGVVGRAQKYQSVLRTPVPAA